MKRLSVSLILAVIFLSSLLVNPTDAAVDEGNYYKYLKKIYEQKNPKLNDYLINECNKFLELYKTTGGMAAEVRYVVGLLYLEKEDYSMAVAAFLRGLFLDPVSERMNDEREQIKKIIANEKYFRNFSEKIDKATEGPFIEKPLDERNYDFLNTLYSINDQKLHNFMVEEFKSFAVNFPRSKRVEDLQTKTANLYRMDEDYLKAIAAYEKIESLFPESTNIPANRLKIATMRYMKLKDYETAAKEFKVVTEEFPGKEVSGDAYFYLGEINQERFKNYAEAIKNYQSVALNYVNNENAVESIFRVSKIYHRNLKNYEKAIEALGKVGRNFSGDARAPESYDRIAEIYEEDMKDYDSAITTYKKLAETYPESSIASDRLYEAAYISEKRLKDYGNAISLYEDVRSMFPDSKESKKAKKKIAKLKKKLVDY